MSLVLWLTGNEAHILNTCLVSRLLYAINVTECLHVALHVGSFYQVSTSEAWEYLCEVSADPVRPPFKTTRTSLSSIPLVGVLLRSISVSGAR